MTIFIFLIALGLLVAALNRTDRRHQDLGPRLTAHDPYDHDWARTKVELAAAAAMDPTPATADGSPSVGATQSHSGGSHQPIARAQTPRAA